MSRWPECRLESLIPGQELITPRGVCYLATLTLPLGSTLGGHCLEDFLRMPRAALGLAGGDRALAELPLAETVFLDTETTGLAGGTGTPAFLVGIGFFVQNGFRIEQYFMRRLSEEAALCAALHARLQQFHGIVSFNGRTFDLPLLETRFRLSRMRPPLAEALHFDLLHAARRLWRTSLPGCSLGLLERHLLHVYRPNDVESWRIPGIYLDYLHTGDPSDLRLVFEHNRQDVLSMVALAVRISQTVAAVSSIGGPRRADLTGCELASLGRLCEVSGYPEDAQRLYEAALVVRLETGEHAQTLQRLALLKKRSGRWSEAVVLWERTAATYPGAAQAALVELAKYYEHRARDFSRAYECALRARSMGSGSRDFARLTDFDRRLHRLRRRLDVAAATNAEAAHGGIDARSRKMAAPRDGALALASAARLREASQLDAIRSTQQAPTDPWRSLL